MKIGIDATCVWNQRGFGRFTRELLHALVPAHPEHEWTLVVDRVPAPGELPAQAQVLGVRPRRRVTESAVATSARTLGDLRAFTKAVGTLRPDVFFFPAVYSFFPLPLRTRALVGFHDTIAECFPGLVFPRARARWAWALKIRWALWQATRVLTVSETSRQDLVHRFRLPIDRIDVVTEGAAAVFSRRGAEEIAASSRLCGIPVGVPYFVVLGGVSPHKNVPRLLEAFQRVRGEPEPHLLVVGDLDADGFLADGERVRSLAAHPALASRCHLLGRVDDETLAGLLSGAVALAFPSLAEGFGLPAVEAMACGIPVLASARGALPEVVGDGGILFDPLDVSAMAQACTRVLIDRDLRADLAARARARSRAFTWARAADLTIDAIRRTASP